MSGLDFMSVVALSRFHAVSSMRLTAWTIRAYSSDARRYAADAAVWADWQSRMAVACARVPFHTQAADVTQTTVRSTASPPRASRRSVVRS